MHLPLKPLSHSFRPCGRPQREPTRANSPYRHVAANKGLVGMVRLLLEVNAQPSAKDNDKRTPLQAAVNKGHSDVARLLRSSGATLGWDEVTASGELCEAAKGGNLEKLDLLITCGAAINAADCAPRQPHMHLLHT